MQVPQPEYNRLDLFVLHHTFDPEVFLAGPLPPEEYPRGDSSGCQSRRDSGVLSFDCCDVGHDCLTILIYDAVKSAGGGSGLEFERNPGGSKMNSERELEWEHGLVRSTGDPSELEITKDETNESGEDGGVVSVITLCNYDVICFPHVGFPYHKYQSE